MCLILSKNILITWKLFSLISKSIIYFWDTLCHISKLLSNWDYNMCCIGLDNSWGITTIIVEPFDRKEENNKFMVVPMSYYQTDVSFVHNTCLTHSDPHFMGKK